MAKVQIILPAMGEGIIEAEITRWLVKEGQKVAVDDPLVEVATDKVDSEIPSPSDGFIHKILVSEGEVPRIGQVIAILTSDKETSAFKEETENAPDSTDYPDKQIEPMQSPEQGTIIQKAMDMNGGETIDLSSYSSSLADVAFLSPITRKIIKDHKLSPLEISSIKGSGLKGRITRKDLEDYLDRKGNEILTEIKPENSPGQPTGNQSDLAQKKPSPEYTHPDPHTHTPMGRMRQKIAEHMVYSKRIAPHVTSFVETDVTELMDWRIRVKNEFEEKYGQKLTFTPLVVESVIKAIKKFPGINVSVDGNTIIQKKELNIGLATALPDGNLIVPVIREADKLNLAGLATAVNDLAERARNNDLNPEDVRGGTFTISNIGGFGNIAGTPIINQPEVAILAVGAVRKIPAVVETPEGEGIGIRRMLILSLAYDHRVVDGALGGNFLKSIGDFLQNFDSERII
jgi:2-oxoglutarate dehydrogenase E2 component (dihydrolipoamide succinyltransferase)